MKNITLFYVYQGAEDYANLLSSICDAKTENMTVYSIFKDSVTPRALQDIVKIQQKTPLLSKITFRNHAVFLERSFLSLRWRRSLRHNDFFVNLVFENVLSAKPQRLRHCVKRLQRMGIANQLWTKQGEQMQVYRAMEKEGLPICFWKPQYNEQTIAWFDEWLYQSKVIPINVFTDILSMLTLQTKSRNCNFSSCIGKTLFADENGAIYLCPFHPTETSCLGTRDTWKETTPESFVSLMHRCVEKRASCASQCDGFAYCQGGCPFDDTASPDCRLYIETVKHIQNCIRQIYRENRLAEVNPVVRNAILNAIAFHSPFFS